MADTKTTGLPEKTTIADTDLVHVVTPSPAANSKTTALNIRRYTATYYERTAAEITDGTVPTDNTPPPFNVRRYGAVGDGVTDDLTALNSAVSVASQAITDGAYNLVIDLDGCNCAISDTLVLGNTANFVIFSNGALTAIGTEASWTETDSAITAYFAANETVTTDGGTWVDRKPMLEIGASNPGVSAENLLLFCERKSAGIRVHGNAKFRRIRDVRIQEQRSYGIYQEASCYLDHVQVRGNTDGADTDRDAYGIVYDGTDNHWDYAQAQWCHCPLLTTGATLYIENSDIFNGSNSPGSPITNPRLWEHRGNTITWMGGRLGNGNVHVWDTDMAIFPAKIGITNTSTIDYYFKLHASTASQTMNNFLFYPPELPAELRTGTTDWFEFLNDAGGTWEPNTAAELGAEDNSIMVMPRGLRLISTENNNNFPHEVVNAQGAESLTRYRAGAAGVGPNVQIGLLSDEAYLGYNATSGVAVAADEVKNVGVCSVVTVGATSANNGETKNIADGTEQWIDTNTGTIASLTVTLPDEADISEGHQVSLAFAGIVTTLTISSQGSAAITGAPTTAAANDFFRFTYEAGTDTWYRT